MIFFHVLVGVFGLVFGSFISAWSWRIPKEETINKGRSKCAHCDKTLHARDLLPVVSWVLNGGRCRYCRKTISLRYPIIELTTAALFTTSFVLWDLSLPYALGSLLIWLAILVLLLTVAIVDLESYLIPVDLLIGASILALAFVIVSSYGFELDVWRELSSHGLSAVLAGGFFYVLSAVSKERWMGKGDAPLAFLAGLLLGPALTLLMLFIAFNTAAFISLGLIITKLKSRKDLIPFGPFLVLAIINCMLFGNLVLNWYNSLLY